MTERYFVDSPITGGSAVLAGAEAHHLLHVMRGKPGDEVILFDGSGAEFLARVESVSRTHAQLTILSREKIDRELPLELILGVALPKGDRQRWLVEKVVELGVKRLVPLVTARSVARLGEKSLARLRRTVVEASKQCGRNRLMEIAEAQAWSDFVAATQAAPCRLLAHPESRPLQTKRPAERPPLKRVGDSAVLAVGPEGGFASHEVTLATSAGWQPLDLGPRVLRAETAAILLVAMVVQGVE